MEVINREYTIKAFKYEGQLQKDRGAYPELTLGFAIQEHDLDEPTLDFLYDFRYNNFDGAVTFVLQCKTRVNFLFKRPDSDEIFEEVKLVAKDAHKILMSECTKIGKYVFPRKVKPTKSKILPLIIAEIDELYPL